VCVQAHRILREKGEKASMGKSVNGKKRQWEKASMGKSVNGKKQWEKVLQREVTRRMLGFIVL
jgi:hypothetical protein